MSQFDVCVTSESMWTFMYYQPLYSPREFVCNLHDTVLNVNLSFYPNKIFDDI